jgi:transposase
MCNGLWAKCTEWKNCKTMVQNVRRWVGEQIFMMKSKVVGHLYWVMTTITLQAYCKTLKKLCRAIQNKRRGILTPCVVLLHDNARQHTTACTWALLEHFNWVVFDHPPYSPDLAPSNNHQFTYLKTWLKSQHFNSNVELMEGVQMWLSSQSALLWHNHTKSYSWIQQVSQLQQWLYWEVG